MSDLERLTEALAGADSMVKGDYGVILLGGSPLLTAARAYRDLLANGELVEWCDVHDSATHPPSGITALVTTSADLRCDVWVAGRLDGWETKDSCRIVSKLLVDPTTEEER